jgi:membrane protease YdiL (CAAX protease family)
MSARRQLMIGVVLSLVWAGAFVVGVDRESLYPALGGVAAVVVAVVLWLKPGLRSVSSAQGRHVLVGAVVGIAVGVGSVVATHLGDRLFAAVLPGLGHDIERLQRLAGVTPSRLALVVVIAVAEELLWRTLVLDALRQLGLRDPVAVSVAALVYAASQVGPGSPWLVVAAFGCGLLWGALRWRVGLAAAIAAHLVWTLAILGLVPLR